MATRAANGSKNGIEWRTDSKGQTRWRWILNLGTGKQRGEWVRSNAEAKAGRVKRQGEVAAGIRRGATGFTLRDAWEGFYEPAKAGRATDRKGKRYKPATLRGYEAAWRLRIEPELGAHKLEAIRRADVQALVYRWQAEGHAASTVRNSLNPLRTLFLRAIYADQVAINPTDGLDIPAVSSKITKFSTREQAADLIGALPAAQQAVWACAFYGGLRRGELRALRWSHVDFTAPAINVKRSWDEIEGDQGPKSEAAKREVPLVPQLVALLQAHKAATGRAGNDLIFGRTADKAFDGPTVWRRASKVWAAENKRRLEANADALLLEPVGLHAARHTCASLMIYAGANPKYLSAVLGHETIGITFDLYGHLLPGGAAEVGKMLAAYLEGPQTG